MVRSVEASAAGVQGHDMASHTHTLTHRDVLNESCELKKGHVFSRL